MKVLPKVDIDIITPEKLSFGKRMAGFGAVAMAAGIFLLGVCHATGKGQGDDLRRFYFSYTVAFSFFLSLSLGALFFILLQRLLQGVWSVAVMRVAEMFAGNIPLMAALSIPILLGKSQIYPWAAAGIDYAHNELLAHKSPWLNGSFFDSRVAAYFVVLSVISIYYTRQSLAQDRMGAEESALAAVRMKKLSGPALALFVPTIAFISFDLVMSINPYWASSMFCVYFFAGSCMVFFAALSLLSINLVAMGKLRGVITEEHRHDMGKMLFGFVFFWSYIAFSQYLLMWYANIPEETEWYLRRQTGQWNDVSMLLIVGHFAIPFAALVTGQAKRNTALLAVMSIWLIVMHYADLYWLIMPEYMEGRVPLHIMDLMALAGIGLIYKGFAAIMYAGKYLVPFGDPRLPDAIAHHSVP